MRLPNSFESLAIAKCIAAQHLGDDNFSLSEYVRSYQGEKRHIPEYHQRKTVEYVHVHYVAAVTGDGERRNLVKWCCRNAQAIIRLEYR